MPTHGRIHQAPSCPLCALKNSPKIEHRSVTRLTGQGIYAMQMGNDTMDLVNAGTLDSGAL